MTQPRVAGSGTSARWRESRFFLVARLAFMAAAPAPLVFGFAPGTTQLQKVSYAVGLLAIEAGGIIVARQWNRRSGLNARVLHVLPVVDVIALFAMSAVATDAVPDPLYPVFVILPVLYALLLPKRSAIVIGVLSGLAYAFAMAGHHSWEYYSVLVHAERVLAVPLLTWVVASGAQAHRRQVERLQLVSGITEAVHSSLDSEFITPETAEALALVLGLSHWKLSVVEGATREVEFEALEDARGFSTRMFEVRHEGQGEAVRDASRVFEPGEGNDSVTLLVHDTAEVLFSAPSRDLERLSAEDHIVLNAIGRELLVAVENRRLYSITKHLAVTDALTGLFNRRHLTRRLLEETGRARRFGGCVSLLMLDGDGFKRINDVHGHRTGDEILIELAEVMSRSVRDVDVVSRYGGDEFCILLPETDAAGAREVAQKVSAAVAAHRFVKNIHIGISVGAATFPQDAETAENLQQAADNALYRAKKAPVGSICSASDGKGVASSAG